VTATTTGAGLVYAKPSLGLGGIHGAVERDDSAYNGAGLASDGMPATAANVEEFRVIQTMEHAASLTPLTGSRDASPRESPRTPSTSSRAARPKNRGTISTPFGTRLPAWDRGRGSGYNSPDAGSRGSGETSPSGSPAFGRPPRRQRRGSFTQQVRLAYPQTPAADRKRAMSSPTLFSDCAALEPAESRAKQLLVSAVMDPAPFLVTSDTPAARVFAFFRQLNVSVIAVVDYFGCVEGIITRQCFSAEYIARFARAATRNAKRSHAHDDHNGAATPRTPSSSVHSATLRASIQRYAGAQDASSSDPNGLRLRTPDQPSNHDVKDYAADNSTLSSFGERRAKLGLNSPPRPLTLHVTPPRQRSL